MRDFTLLSYKELLLALQKAAYSFYTFEEYCNGAAQGKYVILRHDVDLKAANSLATAQIEHELGIKASYYFRVLPQSNQPDVILRIAALGHEIGYHYEDLSLTKGDSEKAILHFENQLLHFRRFYPVKTICMHGSPASQYDNRDIWKKYNYRNYDIIGEPYFDFLNRKDVLYFTDTGRCWDGDKYSVRDKKPENNNANQPRCHTTADLVSWIEGSPNEAPIMITTHPQRWTNSQFEWLLELMLQNTKNLVKRILVRKQRKT